MKTQINVPKLNILRVDGNLIFPYKFDCGFELTGASAKRDINHVRQDCQIFLWITYYFRIYRANSICSGSSTLKM